jgi:hypothetical protein
LLLVAEVAVMLTLAEVVQGDCCLELLFSLLELLTQLQLVVVVQVLQATKVEELTVAILF